MQAKRQLLFIQGGGEGTHDEWDNKLVESLQREVGQNCEIRYPRMPLEEDPDYTRWRTAIEIELQTLRIGAIIIGHSVGGTILIRLLLEHPPSLKLGAVILLAPPFVGDGGWESDELKFPPDLGKRLPPGIPIHFFHGLEDDTAPPAHVELYARAIPQAQIHRLQGRDHQLNNDLREVAAAIKSM